MLSHLKPLKLAGTELIQPLKTDSDHARNQKIDGKAVCCFSGFSHNNCSVWHNPKSPLFLCVGHGITVIYIFLSLMFWYYGHIHIYIYLIERELIKIFRWEKLVNTKIHKNKMWEVDTILIVRLWGEIRRSSICSERFLLKVHTYEEGSLPFESSLV